MACDDKTIIVSKLGHQYHCHFLSLSSHDIKDHNFLISFKMDCDNQCEHPDQGDFLMLMFERGMHQVLEKIFLSLGLETARRSKKVSQEWRVMLEFYLCNKIPRIGKIVARWIPTESKVGIYSK